MVVFGLFEGDAWGYITSNSSILKKHPFAPQYQKFSMHGAKMRKWQPQMLRGTIRERPLSFKKVKMKIDLIGQTKNAHLHEKIPK